MNFQAIPANSPGPFLVFSSKFWFRRPDCLLIQVTDEGTYINEEERPNQVPPGSQERPGEVAPRPQASPGYSGSGDAEIQELQRAFPTTEWPPSMRKE